MTPATSVSVRELKNQTTAVLRRVEAGDRVPITKRGRVVAIIEPAAEPPRALSDSIYRRLQQRIQARSGLRPLAPAAARREFDRISRKIARTLPYKSWREMDRAAKGDRVGLSRQ
jgi:prevent-host-death family protein